MVGTAEMEFVLYLMCAHQGTPRPHPPSPVLQGWQYYHPHMASVETEIQGYQVTSLKMHNQEMGRTGMGTSVSGEPAPGKGVNPASHLVPQNHSSRTLHTRWQRVPCVITLEKKERRVAWRGEKRGTCQGACCGLFPLSFLFPWCVSPGGPYAFSQPDSDSGWARPPFFALTDIPPRGRGETARPPQSK